MTVPKPRSLPNTPGAELFKKIKKVVNPVDRLHLLRGCVASGPSPRGLSVPGVVVCGGRDNLGDAVLAATAVVVSTRPLPKWLQHRRGMLLVLHAPFGYVQIGVWVDIRGRLVTRIHQERE